MKVRWSSQERINDIIKAMCHITGSNYDDQVTIESWFNTRIKILVDGVILPGYQNTYSHRDDWQLKNHVERLKKEGKNVDILEVGNTFGEWHDWSFFRVRGYKKGTMHFEFQDEKVWMEFNRRVSKIKGWALTTNTNSKQKGTERTRKTGVEVY